MEELEDEMRLTFAEVKMYGRKRTKCSGGCGRILARQRKFYQTMSPFNKLPDGTVKSSCDIYEELKKSVRMWEKEPETCIHCGGLP